MNPYPLSLFTRASWRYSSLGCSLAAPRLLSILILILNEMFSPVFLVSLLWLNLDSVNGITDKPIQEVALHEVFTISLSTPFYSPPDLVYRGDSLLRSRQATVEAPVAKVTALEPPSTTQEQDAVEFSVKAIQVPNNTLNTQPGKMDHGSPTTPSTRSPNNTLNTLPRSGDHLHRWEFRVAFLHTGLTRVQYYEPAENDSIVTEVFFNVIAPSTSSPPSSFVHVGPNGQHFVNSLDGSTFVPIGVNVAWPDNDVKTLADVPAFYDRWFRELAAAGGNCARLWLGPGLTREWPMLGLLKGGEPFGKINEAAAQTIDQVLESAGRHNIKLILVLESFNSLCPEWASGDCHWQESVYNDKNGGPLRGAGFLGKAGFLWFWGNAKILQQWETYVEYVGRRWGAYASVLAFQLFNEADIADLTPAWTVLRWHRQVLAAFRRSLGPYAPFRLLSQSWGLALGDPVIDLPHDLLDYSTTHEYTRPMRGEQDLGKALQQLARYKKRFYGKPTLIDEFGCNDLDQAMRAPTGDVLHQGAWLPLFAGAAGGAMSWWWESVRDRDLLPRLTSVQKFVDNVLGPQLAGRGLEGSVVQAQSTHGARAPVSGLAAYDWSDLTYTLPKKKLWDKNEVLVTGMRGTRRTDARLQGSLSPIHVALVHLRADAWSPCVASSNNNVSAFLLELFIHLNDGEESNHHHVWRLDWVAPESGEVTRTDEITSQDGRLAISVPSFERDVVILLTY